MQKVNFRAADLTDAYLEKSDLPGARYLTIEQLSKVKTLYQTKLDPGLMEQVKKCCSHLLESPIREIDKKDQTN